MTTSSAETNLKEKVCTRCKLLKPVTVFELRHNKDKTKSWYSSWCIPCHNIYKKEWYRGPGYEDRLKKGREYSKLPRVREKHKERTKTYRLKYPDRIKATMKKASRKYSSNKVYGILQEDYERLLKEQGGACKICGKIPKPEERSLALDHHHDTGIVRGLLCDNCNRGIGFFKDNEVFLRRAVDYLHEDTGLRAKNPGYTKIPQTIINAETVNIVVNT